MDAMDNKELLFLDQYLQVLGQATGISMQEQEWNVGFDTEDGQSTVDALLMLRQPDGLPLMMAIEAKKAVYPRDVRLAAYKLLQYRQSYGHDVELCLIAEMLSPNSRNALREAGINYFDSSGTLYFHHRPWVVDIERKPKAHGPRRPAKLFSGAREQVVHALLHHHLMSGPAEFISGAELAVLAETSTYTVSLTMQELERQDFVETKGSGPAQRRRLRDADGLLDAWAADWVHRREVVSRWYAYSPSGAPVDHLLQRLGNRQLEGWALTGAAAANALVHRLTNVTRVEVIVPLGQAEHLAEELILKPADQGANILFIERAGAALMFLDEHPERPGSRFASPYIQYLDLLNGYGRNKELAEEYRHRVLKLEPAAHEH